MINKWCKWFKSPLNGFFLLKILTQNNLNISIPGIINIKKISSQDKFDVSVLYLFIKYSEINVEIKYMPESPKYEKFFKLNIKKIIKGKIKRVKNKFNSLLVSKINKKKIKNIIPELPLIPSAILMLFRNSMIKKGVIKIDKLFNIKVLSILSK